MYIDPRPSRASRETADLDDGRSRFVNWASFIEQLGVWFEQHELAAPAMPWVLGISGGPDSTLLLHAMHELSRRRGWGWTLHVAHLHHGLRGADADADAAFVAGLAQRLELPFHEERTSIPAQVAAEGGSTEEVARRYRYEFLERIALKTGSDAVAVAHHADDDAETILYRVFRGTGLRGLAGMPEIRPIQPGSRIRLVRPLLHERRATIEALCSERGIECRLDPTNVRSDFTRSRIRNVVLPLLRQQINPNVSDAVLRLAEQARWLGTYLADAAARVFDSLVVAEAPQRIELNVRALLAKQKIIQAEVVRRAISLVSGREQDLSFHHIEAVLKLAADRASGKELHLPGPVAVRKVYERLEFQPITVEEAPPQLLPVFVHCPGTTPLPQLSAELVAEVCDVDMDKIDELRRAHRPYEEWLDYERVQLPLLVRGRREGDRFWPLGAPGSKRLSDFFIEQKIDPPLRARIGVLCDQAGPVWIMPLRIDERVKLRPTSRRALRLVLRTNGQPAAGAP